MEGRLAIILQPEVYNILQVIKRHGPGIRFFSDEHSLVDMVQSFSALRRRLRQVDGEGGGEEPITIEECLKPFLGLLRSAETTSSIVASGLGSLAKLLRSGFFRVWKNEGERATIAFRNTVLTVARCRFETGDISGDEIALQRLTDVLILALRDPMSRLLSDSEVCAIVETCFTICVLPRVGELFKREAELSCIEICSLVLSRVGEEEATFLSAIPISSRIKIAYPGTRVDDPEPLPPVLAALEAELEAEQRKQQVLVNSNRGKSTIDESLLEESKKVSSAAELTILNTKTESGEQRSPSVHFVPEDRAPTTAGVLSAPATEVVAPYSMAAIMAILNHLLRLLEVGERRNTDRMRSLCLVILSDFIEVHYELLPKCEILWDLLSTKVTRQLVQLLMSNESQLMTVNLHQAILSVFGRFRRRLVAQTEFLLVTLLGLLNQKPSPGGRPPTKVSKEFYLELLGHFCLDPSFLTDLYVQYECGASFGYVLSDLVQGLCTITLADPKLTAPQDTAAYMISLELLLGFLKSLAKVAGGPGAGTEEQEMEAERLRRELNLKALNRKSVDLFNRTGPREAFNFLVENKLTEHDPPTAKEIAQYLRRTTGLDKRMIGEIVSKPSNAEILREFLADFDLAGLEIDEALRLVLESFRLPGESQQISRIMESLAAAYFPTHKGIFHNEDAVFVLAYSIVMLNTDQHNRQVKHRMSLEDFIRNNRGINGGSDFDPNFLRRIFQAIRDKEIVLPEEQSNEAAFAYIWNEQLKKYRPSDDKSAKSTTTLVAVGALVPDMMKILWEPLLNCFRTLILTPRTDTTSRIAVKGLHELGRGADLSMGCDQLDELARVLVECLSFAEISTNSAGNQIPRYLARSELFRMLVRCFFDLYRLHGAKMRNGWRFFVTHLMMLVESNLVTLATFEVADGSGNNTSRVSGGKVVDNRSASPSLPRSNGGGGGGGADRSESIFSTLSQYLVASPVDSIGVIDGETKFKAMEFLKSCKLEEIIRDSRLLTVESLQSLMGALIDPLRILKPPLWDSETLVLIIDLVVHAAWINRDRMIAFWSILFSRFSDLAKDLMVPTTIREHVILGLGRLSLRFADKPEMQKEVVQFFQLLCYVPPETFPNLAEPALSIVLRIVELDPPILHGTAIWPHYFTVLALAGRSRSCGPYSFGLLTTIVREEELLFPLDFYAEYVDLLNGFVASSTNSIVTLNVSLLSASGDFVPTPIELASQALQKFSLLEANVRRLASKGAIINNNGSLWSDYIIPVHCAIAQQCYHPIREIRQQALSLLQRTILAIDFTTSSQGGITSLYEEFRLVLIPLLEELQRPEMRKLEGNVEEIQVRAAVVVSRILLSNLTLLFPPLEVTASVPSAAAAASQTLWATILGHFLNFLTGRSDVLRESIPETIKNMLLVMASSNVLRPPKPGEPSGLWLVTWQLLNPVMPRVKSEIFEITLAATSPKDYNDKDFDNNVDNQDVDDNDDGTSFYKNQLQTDKREKATANTSGILKVQKGYLDQATIDPPIERRRSSPSPTTLSELIGITNDAAEDSCMLPRRISLESKPTNQNQSGSIKKNPNDTDITTSINTSVNTSVTTGVNAGAMNSTPSSMPASTLRTLDV